ncbi:uncharacterized protein K02A2.6-like [Macrosteles quadrilineatus]|uniref:uncharacterized protein K02A2.6-like n=1 Tax=Macrosteles quadrilineatus TaxID=74068 RepID=UPI0023E2EE4F|nr:uncharacterized protein K02A2.6-like [Macrosteles quadrilineatus]
MTNIQPPEPFDFTEKRDATENWKLFKCQWKNYVTLAEAFSSKSTNLSNKKIRLALFLSVIGGKAVRLINKLFNEPSDVDEIISRLDEYFQEAKNVTYERYNFNSAKQDAQESCKDYINRLHELVGKCDFEALANLSKKEIEEQLICDRLVAGIANVRLRKRLLTKSDLSLNKATQLCIADEHSESLALKINSRNTEEDLEENKDNSFRVERDTNMRTCKFCGKNHIWGAKNCAAYGKVCSKCKQKNHFANVCKQNIRKVCHVEAASRPKDDTSAYEDRSNSDDDIYHVKEEIPKKRLFIDLPLCMKDSEPFIKCQLDSGSSCNVIGYETLKKLVGIPRLKESSTRLTFYGGESQFSLGKVQLIVKWKNKKHKLIFEVIETPHNPLLGAQDCINLGLILFDELVYQIQSCKVSEKMLSSFPDIGNGLGCFEGHCEFKLDTSVRPIVVPPRRYPVALKKEIQDEIKRLEDLQVIKKVTEPTDWVSAMVVVKKPNKLRICIDPHQLNKAIKRPNYQALTIKEIAPQLSKAKIFSKLDLKDGFWHVKLTEDSSKLTTFWTPYGRYRWLRLPFGIFSAPEEFQRRVNEQFEDL